MRKRIVRAALAGAIALVASVGALRAEEILPTDGAGEGDSGPKEIIVTDCAQGNLKECGTRTTKVCSDYRLVSGGGGISIGPGSGSLSGTATWQCMSYTETTVKLYKDKYKTA